MKITEYRIVGPESPKETAKEVNSLIENGWQPLGPAQDSSTPESTFVFQTMVKCVKEKRSYRNALRPAPEKFESSEE